MPWGQPGHPEASPAEFPMVEVLRYASGPTSMTSGRGGFGIWFANGEPAPGKLAARVVAVLKKVGAPGGRSVTGARRRFSGGKRSGRNG